MVEGLIKQATGRELDISEEYLAWAAKSKAKLRVAEEDSSVAVNAFTLQQFGFLLEEDFPYQPSWFNQGFPCNGQAGKPTVDPTCFSHTGPGIELSKRILSGKALVFEAVDSGTLAVVQSLAHRHAPVTVSILGHRAMWEQECQQNPKLCSGHAALIVGYDLDNAVELPTPRSAKAVPSFGQSGSFCDSRSQAPPARS